jgi:hypothetical protein
MKPPRVYIDTSVVGGCLDLEFQTASLQLFERFREGTLIAVVSDLTIVEVDAAPPEVRALLRRIPVEHREHVLVTDRARALAERYIAAGVIGGRMRPDARHIATATIHRVDVLASWNFKHIVNERRVYGYNSVNVQQGHPFLEIRTPAEMMGDGE